MNPLKSKKTRKVRLYGGFHNSQQIVVRVDGMMWDSFEKGYICLREVFSQNQLKRLDNHFCGIKGCKCGGVSRAEYDEL